MEYISIKELLAEVESKFPILADSGELDKTSIYTTVLSELRKFGVDALQKRRAVVQIQNGRGILPDNFKKLKEARRIDYHCHEVENSTVGDTCNYITREYIENPAYYDQISGNYVITCDPKVVTEKITIHNTNVDVKYKSEYVEIVDGVFSDSISPDCVNRKVKSPHKISVTNLTVNANFDKGSLYIEYYALPTNESGEISVPLITTGDLYNYILNKIQINIAEFLIANNLNPQGIQSLYQVWLQQDRILRAAAESEVKFHGLKDGWNKRMKVVNQANYNKYNPYKGRWR